MTAKEQITYEVLKVASRHQGMCRHLIDYKKWTELVTLQAARSDIEQVGSIAANECQQIKADA